MNLKKVQLNVSQVKLSPENPLDLVETKVYFEQQYSAIQKDKVSCSSFHPKQTHLVQN